LYISIIIIVTPNIRQDIFGRIDSFQRVAARSRFAWYHNWYDKSLFLRDFDCFSDSVFETNLDACGIFWGFMKSPADLKFVP